MILQKHRRQLSDKSITLAHGSEAFFVPLSFAHRHIDNILVDIEFPQWFLDKHNTRLQEMERNTNLLIKRLCDQE